jgi:hypothetical protein
MRHRFIIAIVLIASISLAVRFIRGRGRHPVSSAKHPRRSRSKAFRNHASAVMVTAEGTVDRRLQTILLEIAISVLS